MPQSSYWCAICGCSGDDEADAWEEALDGDNDEDDIDDDDGDGDDVDEDDDDDDNDDNDDADAWGEALDGDKAGQEGDGLLLHHHASLLL